MAFHDHMVDLGLRFALAGLFNRVKLWQKSNETVTSEMSLAIRIHLVFICVLTCNARYPRLNS